MLNVTLTVGLGPLKDPVVMTWPDVSKLQILDIEEQLLDGLMKLNAVGVAIAEGNLAKSPNTNPIEMVIEFLVEEDGVKWNRAVIEYPNMGEEAQAMFLGMLTGQMTGLKDETRAQGRMSKGKGKGKEKEKGKA